MDVSFGLFGLLYLALVIWAILSIAQSTHGTLGKTIWLLVILIPQPFGALIWLFFGPRAGRTYASVSRYSGRGYSRHSW